VFSSLFSLGVVAGSGDQRCIALNANHTLCGSRHREGEVAYPAEQVQHFRGGGQLQELHCTRDQRLIHRTVDLDEIGGQEFELHLELG